MYLLKLKRTGNTNDSKQFSGEKKRLQLSGSADKLHAYKWESFCYP